MFDQAFCMWNLIYKQIKRRTIEFYNNRLCEIYEKFVKLNFRSSLSKKISEHKSSIF